MSELKRFLYLRISGVSFSDTMGVTLTLMCEPRRWMLPVAAGSGGDCCWLLLPMLSRSAPKPNAWNERDDGFLRIGGLLTACRYCGDSDEQQNE